MILVASGISKTKIRAPLRVGTDENFDLKNPRYERKKKSNILQIDPFARLGPRSSYTEHMILIIILLTLTFFHFVLVLIVLYRPIHVYILSIISMICLIYWFVLLSVQMCVFFSLLYGLAEKQANGSVQVFLNGYRV